MISYQQAKQIFDASEEIYSAPAVIKTVKRMAMEITEVLSDQYPLILCVMGGAVVFSGQLLPQLNFPLNFDYVHASRYNETTQGGQLSWKMFPQEKLKGRVVLVLDDILDEGITLTAIRERVMADGARAFYSAVFADKKIAKTRTFRADFVGVTVPDRYVFGFGMDIQGVWRNLPAIYALRS